MGLNDIQVNGNEQQIILEQGTKQRLTAKTPEQLIKQQFGWSLPIKNLSFWILSLPAPHKLKQIKLDSAHHLIQLKQEGWLITYNNFVSINGIDLPTKIDLVNNTLFLRMIIKTWTLNSTNI